MPASRRHAPMAAALLLLIAAATSGCAGKRASHVQSLDGVEAGKHVRVEGTLSLRGSTPITTPVLEIDSTEAIPLNSKSASIMSQLRGLSGMRCAVEGDVLPFVDHNLPRLAATRFELLPLPDGKQPILGIASVEDGQVIVTTESGQRYWIRGDLVGALTEYDGARVWIVGDVFDTDVDTRPKKSTPLTATGYGVVDEAPSPLTQRAVDVSTSSMREAHIGKLQHCYVLSSRLVLAARDSFARDGATGEIE